MGGRGLGGVCDHLKNNLVVHQRNNHVEGIRGHSADRALGRTLYYVIIGKVQRAMPCTVNCLPEKIETVLQTLWPGVLLPDLEVGAGSKWTILY